MNCRYSIRFQSTFIAAGLIVALGGASAQAGFVTWEFAGEVTSVQDDTDLLGGAVTAGSPFSGTFTFDPDASAIEAPIYRDAIIDVAGAVGSIPFNGPTDFLNSILVLNDFPSSGFDNYSMKASVHLLTRELVATISLRDNEGDMLTSAALLSVPPPFELIDNARFTLNSTLEDFSVQGKITSVTLVPEPATLGLLAIGTLALLRRKPFSFSQRTHTRKKGSKTLVPVVGAVLFLFVLHASVGGADCNNNGVDDSVELAECPDIEIVFLFDTSGSMDGVIEDLCVEIGNASFDLTDSQGNPLTVTMEMLEIAPGDG